MNILRRPQILLLIVAITLLATTFLNPSMPLKRPTYRYVFVFDISQSMNVKDIPETDSSINRLDFAKKMAKESLIEFSCGTEFGVAIFTGHRPFLLIKPVEICSNQQELSRIISNVNWRMTWETKSEIAKGLFKSIRLMKQLDKETRLVFFTDGHEAPPVNDKLQPRFNSEKSEVKGIIVGTGGEIKVPIPKFNKKGKQTGYWKMEDVAQVDVYTQDQETLIITKNNIIGTEHLSSLRETYLKELATKTGLDYIRAGLTDELSVHMKTDVLSIPRVITTDMRWLWALSSLLIFIITLVITPLKNLVNNFKLKKLSLNKSQ